MQGVSRSFHKLSLMDFLLKFSLRELFVFDLDARDWHTPEMALTYDIKCPKCGALLKQVARQNSGTELGLYTCKVCSKD